MKRSILLLLGVVIGLPLSVSAQSLKSPAEFLGYEMGQRFTYHHRAVDYVRHVGDASPNVVVIPYGETYEGRPLLVAVVSSEANIRNLDAIRENNLKRVGLMPGDAQDDGIAIVWLAHNIHGNESVSMEAAMMTLWRLADPLNGQARQWLENTVVVIDPVMNPDGRDRYAVWYHQTVGKTFNPHRSAREHYEPWPGGRANHYLFDLNRDWAWQTQIESQHRAALYRQWYPHVHADLHEMGPDSPYYFAPAAAPYHEAITPFQRRFQVEIGQNHASYFDEDFRLYYTKERFDLFYPSYGDTWPTYQGAIGMTYEQGGSGFAGLGVTTAVGDTLTLAFRIHNQHRAGMSTVDVTARNARRVTQEFATFYRTSRTNPATRYKSFVIRDGGNPDRLREFLDLMDKQDIRYGAVPARRTVNAFDYTTGRNANVTLETTDVVISLYQPKSVLAHVLLEPRTTIVDSLTYDITAWSLPYAYGLQAYALTERLEPSNVDVRARLNRVQAPAPMASAPYAYVAEWRNVDDVRFLARIQAAGIRVRSSTKGFTMAGNAYAPGTLVIPRTDNMALGERFDRIVQDAARDLVRPLLPATTGLVDAGLDFGSDFTPFIKAPKVAVLAGEGVNSLAYGEVWHYFDQQIGYPMTAVNIAQFGGLPLHEFDVLILPSGNFRSVLSGDHLTRVMAWVRGGGTLIAMEAVVGQLSTLDGFDMLKQKKGPDEPTGEALLRTYGDDERESMRTSLAGAIYRVRLDSSHPLGFGFDGTYHTLKRGGAAYEYLTSGWNVGTIPKDGFVSGFVGHELKPRLEQTLVFGEIPMGRGRVVVMVDNPLFRAFWHSGKILFANAVFQVAR